MHSPRMPGETESDYGEFLLWLQTPRPRALPPQGAALTWAWGERARAHDAGADLPVEGLRAESYKLLHRIIHSSLLKHYRNEVASPGTYSATELARLYAVAEGLKGATAPGAAGDLSGLTDADLEAAEKVAVALRGRVGA